MRSGSVPVVDELLVDDNGPVATSRSTVPAVTVSGGTADLIAIGGLILLWLFLRSRGIL